MWARYLRFLNSGVHHRVLKCPRLEAESLFLIHVRNMQISHPLYCHQSLSGLNNTNSPKPKTAKRESISHQTCNKKGKYYMSKASKKAFPKLHNSKHDPDTFGTLVNEQQGFSSTSEDFLPDDIEGDGDKEFIPLLQVGERPTANIHQLKELLRGGKLKEALTVFQKDIVKGKEAKVIPPMYILLIGECGRFGYTKMAFKLFKRMREHGYDPTGATITALFNACAECPFPKYGLMKANQLCSWIERKGFVLNSMSYHAKMKAFGRCGDLEKAFEVIDEMMEQKLPLSTKGLNFLLVACISDKEAGLAHAIQVIRKMRKYRIVRNVYTYNLLLRTVRDCDIGPPEVVQELLQWDPKAIPPPKKMNKLKIPSLSIKYLMATDDNQDTDDLCESAKLQADATDTSSEGQMFWDNYPIENETEQIKSDSKKFLLDEEAHVRQKEEPEMEHAVLPNLLDPYSSPNTMLLDIRNTEAPENRLALIGGLDGFLALMAAENVKPDIKTFSLLLDLIPKTLEAENQLMNALQKLDVKPDTDFFNLVIKRRTFRHEFKSALSLLLDMSKHNLLPDIVTFGVLATGCSTSKRAKKLLGDMQIAGFHPNIEIIGAFMRNAVTFFDYWYVIDVMKIMKAELIKPDYKILDLMEKAHKDGERMRAKKDRGEEVSSFCKSEVFDKSFRAFCLYYDSWLKSVDVEVPHHPWKQYTAEIQRATPGGGTKNQEERISS